MAFQIPATISTKSLITAGKFLIPSVAVATPVGTTISESLTRQQVEVLLEETRKLNQKLEGEKDEVERKALREIETKTEEVEKIFGVKMQALMENVKAYQEMAERAKGEAERTKEENERLQKDKSTMWNWHQNREEKVKQLEQEIKNLKEQLRPATEIVLDGFARRGLTWGGTDMEVTALRPVR